MTKFEVKKKEIHARSNLLEDKMDELARREADLQGRREELLAEEKERKERRSRVNIFLHRGWRPDGLSGLLQRRMKMISSVVNI